MRNCQPTQALTHPHPVTNNLLNHRIGMKLDAMSQGNHPTDKL
jgi:hypothetical protein